MTGLAVPSGPTTKGSKTIDKAIQVRGRPRVSQVLAGLSFLFGTALTPAQEAASEDDARKRDLEEVVVTGTRIKNRDFTSPSPLATVSRLEIEFSGQPTLEEYLNQLPQMQPVTGRAHNNGSDGQATLNLRAMGPGRTLVLMNGRRVAPSGTGSAVDINNLPSTLVDRVEIITGGASTVYGSDAIAGVVNFITRDDFSGLSLESSYSITEQGDSDIWDFNAVYGFNLVEGGNITFYAGRYEREELFADERAISSVVLLDDWFSGELQTGGSSNVPGAAIFAPRVDFGNGPDRVTWDPNGIPRPFVRPDDLYNYQPLNYVQTPLSRDTFGIMGQVPLTSYWEAYFEGGYARNEHRAHLAPAPFQGFILVNTNNPVLTPETRQMFSGAAFEIEPGLAGMFLGKRLLEMGPRVIANDRKYLRLVGGIRGSFASGWDLDAWVTYSDIKGIESTFNTGSVSRIQQGLLVDPATGQCFDPSGGCVPVNLFGEGNLSAEALDFIRVNGATSTTERTQWLASAVLTGQPFSFRERPVDMAFGLEWRSDEAHFEADDLFYTGDAIGLRGDSPIDGSESVWELYSEALLPLFERSGSSQRLELELGGRWSSYKNAGDVKTWKAGLNWQVTDALRFRTMFQHAVRAPNNEELFRAQYSEFSYYVGNFTVDPCSASQDPVGSGVADKCVLQGLPRDQLGVFEATQFYPTEFVLGGNPNLVPESSDTFTIGAVFSPASIEGLTFTVDYYDIEITDTIGGIDPGVVCFDAQNTAGTFCENLIRDATGNVSRVDSFTQNRGLLATEGIDVQVQYTTDVPERLALFDGGAQLSIGAMFNHTMSLDFQENIVTDVIDCNGVFGWPCHSLFGINVGTYPENRFNANFNYRSGPMTLNLAWRWIDGTDNAAPLGSDICCGISDPVLAIPKVSSWNYFDLGVAYEWDNGLLLRGGVNNLLDRDPPLMADQQGDMNTDALLYDIFGRTYFLNLRYQFAF